MSSTTHPDGGRNGDNDTSCGCTSLCRWCLVRPGGGRGRGAALMQREAFRSYAADIAGGFPGTSRGRGWGGSGVASEATDGVAG
jgi:hypothetical protein